MKKYLVAGAFLIGFTSYAQGTLEQGGLQLNAGVGLSSWGVPIIVGIDYGIAQDFTIGVEGSYRSKKEDYYASQWKHTVWGIAANGNYHFNRILRLPKEFDLYAGLNIGYYNWNSKWEGPGGDYITYSGSYSSGLGLYAQIGGRYFFTNNFGINLEANGGNVSGAKIGITYKF